MTGGPCLCRCLIPLRSLARRLAALRFCPRSGKRRGLQQRCFISGLYHAASELAVYASQSASRRPTQDSLAAGGQPFAARDWLPAGHHRSFNHSLHGILFSRLGLAQFPWKPQQRLDAPCAADASLRTQFARLSGPVRPRTGVCITLLGPSSGADPVSRTLDGASKLLESGTWQSSERNTPRSSSETRCA